MLLYSSIGNFQPPIIELKVWHTIDHSNLHETEEIAI